MPVKKYTSIKQAGITIGTTRFCYKSVVVQFNKKENTQRPGKRNYTCLRRRSSNQNECQAGNHPLKSAICFRNSLFKQPVKAFLSKNVSLHSRKVLADYHEQMNRRSIQVRYHPQSYLQKLNTYTAARLSEVESIKTSLQM